MCPVKCPDQLWQATGLRRSDETNSGYTCAGQPVSSGGTLTRMMDCAKPSYGWNGNVKGSTYPGYELVVPCRRDGYTRINGKSFNVTVATTLAPVTRPSNTTLHSSGSSQDMDVGILTVFVVVPLFAGILFTLTLLWFLYFRTSAQALKEEPEEPTSKDAPNLLGFNPMVYNKMNGSHKSFFIICPKGIAHDEMI